MKTIPMRPRKRGANVVGTKRHELVQVDTPHGPPATVRVKFRRGPSDRRPAA